jgi:hypothetical protein
MKPLTEHEIIDERIRQKVDKLIRIQRESPRIYDRHKPWDIPKIELRRLMLFKVYGDDMAYK